MIDPAGSTLTKIPGAVTFHDPNRPPSDAATARFVPRDPEDLDAYGRVYGWCFDRFPRYVWADEAGLILPAHGCPKPATRYLVQGRKRQLGHLACHTRPREISRNLIGQAQHVIVFALPNPDDRRHVADLVGIAPRDFDALLARLEPKGFLWWRQGQGVTLCPPLSPADVRRLS